MENAGATSTCLNGNKKEISHYKAFLCIMLAFLYTTIFFLPRAAAVALKVKADILSCLLVSQALSLKEPQAYD